MLEVNRLASRNGQAEWRGKTGRQWEEWTDSPPDRAVDAAGRYSYGIELEPQ